MKIKVKLEPWAIMPTRAHEHDAGLDLYAAEDKRIPGFASRKFDTGVHIAIPEGYVGDVKSKSSLMMQHDVTTDGTVDAGYTGTIWVKLFNNSPLPYDVKKGHKIAQLVLKAIITPELELVDDLEDTPRGDNGFGSTGL